ncbi:MAG: beta-glucuronidase [Bryobacteraceae bacterium]|nr:MAG: beta-glucuronidase [Bryobacteraceae bacterium]
MQIPVVCTLAFLACAAAAQSIPRPEHPQPQFMRPEWRTLNGTWQFAFDDKDEGLGAGWHLTAQPFTRNIVVPFCFESKLSGIGDTSFHPVVWYRRQFEIPAGWKGRRVLLHFGAVDYKATVWVNGQIAGEHEGGNTPFRFDITPMLKAGANTVVVRAWDPPEDRAIPRGKQYWEPKSRSIFYTRTTGIWQSVWLEAAGESWLESVRIAPKLDGTVTFHARAARPQAGLTLHVTVKSGDQVVASGAGSLSDTKYLDAAAFVRNPRLWTLERPHLYDAVLELKKGAETLDTVQSYFGFREVSIENGRFCLNHRPVYLKFLLDQGYWPESLLTPPSDEAIQYDIRMSKEMGFNGVRKHQKVEDPRFLYWADKMGFLVSGEMANAYLYDEQYVARFLREWTEAVERDINHPSVVMWAPLNESWGVPDMRDPRQQAHLRTLYHLTKSLDPTRPVIDNEGWEHVETTDLYAVHDYAPNHDALYSRWAKVEVKPGAALPPNGRPYAAPGFQYNGAPLYLSEFGGIAYILPGMQAPESAWGYSGVEKTAEDALKRLEGLYEAIAKLPFMGICYTQITDVEQEINGLMTYDRKPKFDPKRIKALNDRLR